MSKQKRKKHGYLELLQYMQLLENGITIDHITKKYGIDRVRLKVIWIKYQKIGVEALKKKKNIKADYELKKKIVLDIEKNHLTLSAASLKYGASSSQIFGWLKRYRLEGLDALKQIKKRGIPRKMGRPKKDQQKPLTELERLRKENQELKTENALLKKLRALALEREAKLKGIWQEPSKN